MNGVPRLLAISDLHLEHRPNRDFVQHSLRAGDERDWLIIAGDVATRLMDFDWAMHVLRERFDTIVWAPGNRDLWTDPDQPELLGERRYDRLVALCRDAGVCTPEDTYPIWQDASGPVVIAPLFVLYDFSMPAVGVESIGQARAAAVESGAVSRDEWMLQTDPFPSREAWCHARVAESERRLGELPADARTVLVNHYPLNELAVRALHHQHMALWSGTELTADWHRRFHALAVVYGHLHMPRTTVIDGVRFEDVSMPPGDEPGRPARLLAPRQILPLAGGSGDSGTSGAGRPPAQTSP